MNDSTSPQTPDPQHARLDVLIDAIVDGSVEPGQWEEFRALAGSSHEPWRRLAEQQRLMKSLEVGFDQEVRDALVVELPGRQSIRVEETPWSMAAWRPLVGWAAALAMGLAWAGTTLFPHSPGAPPSQDSLLVQYMAQPHVVGELPIEIHDVSRSEGGEFVTYVRQIVERRPVNLYDLQMDENSNPVLREASSEPMLLAGRF